MPGIEDAVKELKQIRADLDALPGKIDKLQAMFNVQLNIGFHEMLDKLIQITMILNRHPELEQAIKEMEEKK